MCPCKLFLYFQHVILPCFFQGMRSSWRYPSFYTLIWSATFILIRDKYFGISKINANLLYRIRLAFKVDSQLHWNKKLSQYQDGSILVMRGDWKQRETFSKPVCLTERRIWICAYNDNKHINLNDKEEQQLWITKNW